MNQFSDVFNMDFDEVIKLALESSIIKKKKKKKKCKIWAKLHFMYGCHGY